MSLDKSKTTFGRVFERFRTVRGGEGSTLTSRGRSARHRKSIPSFIGPVAIAAENASIIGISDAPKRSSSWKSLRIHGKERERREESESSDLRDVSSGRHSSAFRGTSKRSSATSFDSRFHEQFAELCDIVRCNVAKDNLWAEIGGLSSSGDESDDSLAADLRQYLPVKIQSIRPLESLRVTNVTTRRGKAKIIEEGPQSTVVDAARQVRADDAENYSFPPLLRRQATPHGFLATDQEGIPAPFIKVREVDGGLGDEEDRISIPDCERISWEQDGCIRTTRKSGEEWIEETSPVIIEGVDLGVDPTIERRPPFAETDITEGFQDFFSSSLTFNSSTLGSRSYGRDYWGNQPEWDWEHNAGKLLVLPRSDSVTLLG